MAGRGIKSTIIKIVLCTICFFILGACSEPTAGNDDSNKHAPFTNLTSWTYLYWETSHDGETTFPGDTINIELLQKSDSSISFIETYRGYSFDYLSDTLFFDLLVDSCGYRYKNRENFTGDSQIWYLPDTCFPKVLVDSNYVQIIIDEDKFDVSPVFSSYFTALSNDVKIFDKQYTHTQWVYFDARPISYDGPALLLVYSPRLGLVTTIKSGGFRPLAQTGWLLKDYKAF